MVDIDMMVLCEEILLSGHLTWTYDEKARKATPSGRDTKDDDRLRCHFLADTNELKYRYCVLKRGPPDGLSERFSVYGEVLHMSSMGYTHIINRDMTLRLDRLLAAARDCGMVVADARMDKYIGDKCSLLRYDRTTGGVV
jgi:hypothetical protein